MVTYTEVFGGGVASPADVQYRAITLSASVTLQWPSSNEDQPEVVARQMDVTPSGAGFTITMPAANLAATGENTLIRNLGSDSFTVLDNDGGTISVLTAGQVKYIYVTSNSTTAGTWGVFTFGTGTSGADASALAGAGLEASASLLRQALNVTFIAAAYTAGVGDRATVLEYTGGVATLSLTAAATLGDNWFVYVTNQGTGTLTIDPNSSETIDGASTAAILQGESCMVVCDGTNFVTIGRGRSVSLTTTAASINIAGSGTISLSTAQIAAQIQNLTGLLTGNRTVYYGTSAGFWFVTNSTTGSYSVTLKTDSSDTGVVIASGTSGIYTSNGVNLTSAFSAGVGTVTSVATGTGLTGGPITTTGTISLANTAVAAGSYAIPALTVDAQGRITAASESVDAVRITGSQSISGIKTWTVAQRGTPYAYSYSGTITLDMNLGNNFAIGPIGGNFALRNPTNMVAGQSGMIDITVSGTAAYAISYSGAWVGFNGSRPTLNSTSGGRTALSYYALDASTAIISGGGVS